MTLPPEERVWVLETKLSEAREQLRLYYSAPHAQALAAMRRLRDILDVVILPAPGVETTVAADTKRRPSARAR